VAGFALVAAAAAAPALAVEPVAMDQAVQFRADELTYDSRNKITRAQGNVEAVQGDRRLLADEMVYDELRNLVTARGNVTLYEPTGEVISAASMEITGDLKNGVIEDMRAVLADGARLTAERGTRTDGVISEAQNTTYTACFPCADDPSRAPLWQVRSVKVRHDSDEKIVEFSNSWLDFSGVPVFYIPYLYQPDPTVKRKSGLLIPGYGQSSDLGFIVQVPYFVVLSDSQDMTITPWMTSKEGPVLEGQYRQALEHGKIDFSGSATYDSRQRVRGHVFGEARYDIDETWRSGLDVQRTTGRTYLRRYGFDSNRTLTSSLFAEGFGTRDYFTGRGLAFQNLDDDTDQNTIPYVAPYVDYYHVTDQDRFGGRTDVHLDTVTLTRQDGTDTRRLSARAQWQRPFVGPMGDLVTISTAVWGDGYNVDDQSSPGREDRYSGFSGRFFPQASAQWRLPLVREGETVQQIVEPIAEVIAAPNFGNPSRIPNEDSQDFELQETNLFGFDRYPGLDRVDEGPRVTYGFNYTLFGMGGASAQAFLGQSYSLYRDNTFGEGTGLEDNQSDIVMALDLVPVPWFDLLYRNRLDHETLAVRRNELTARVGSDLARLRATYARYDGQPENDLPASEQIEYAVDTQLTRFWRSRVFGITDIRADSQREVGLRVIYEDECFLFSTELARENFKDKDVEPSNVVFFRLGFKTLGDVGSGFKPGGG
jgi:LPS-assembly protein